MKKNLSTKIENTEAFIKNPDILRSENVDAIICLMYYYFGETYKVMDSKLTLNQKKKRLLCILQKVEDDILLQNPGLALTKKSIIDVIYNNISDVDFKIEVKKFKIKGFRFLGR